MAFFRNKIKDQTAANLAKEIVEWEARLDKLAGEKATAYLNLLDLQADNLAGGADEAQVEAARRRLADVSEKLDAALKRIADLQPLYKEKVAEEVDREYTEAPATLQKLEAELNEAAEAPARAAAQLAFFAENYLNKPDLAFSLDFARFPSTFSQVFEAELQRLRASGRGNFLERQKRASDALEWKPDSMARSNIILLNIRTGLHKARQTAGLMPKEISKPRSFTEAVQRELLKGLDMSQAIATAKEMWPHLYYEHAKLLERP